MGIPKRILGDTREEVTILGLGGEGILRTYGNEREAYFLINRALDLGITYCESARAYDGSEAYYGRALKERRKDIFLTSKSHSRDRQGAMAHLHETLKNMDTGYLDLWQVHDVRSEEDLAAIFAPGGAIEAFSEAKEKGFVRFIGVTGHHSPLITRRCLESFAFDTVLLPVNPAEPTHQSFIENVLPLALEKKMGVIGMKVYCHGLVSRMPGFNGMEPFIRFALSHPVTTIVIGCNDIGQLEENVRYASSFAPMGAGEMEELVRRVAPFARQLMYYKP
jgi:predicted aldo/keto reductase-like oxidoreductase